MGSWKYFVSDQIRDQFGCQLTHSFKLSLDSCTHSKHSVFTFGEEAAMISWGGSAVKVFAGSMDRSLERNRLKKHSSPATLHNKFLSSGLQSACFQRYSTPFLITKSLNNTSFSLDAKREEMELSDANFSVPRSSPPFQITLLIRMLYTMAMYGVMALTAKIICDLSGAPFATGIDFNFRDFLLGCLFSLPPAFFVLLLQQDFLTQRFAPALAIKDVEKEEVLEFFYGMKPWQYIFICSIASISEELFFRCAVQGSLFQIMQSSGREISSNTIGMAALVGFFPSLVPCSKALSAIITATIKGSIFYVISVPKQSILLLPRMKNQTELNKRIEAWYQHEELKKIYSPLLESLISLYIGFEWIYTGNLLSPVLTHALYSIAIVWYSIMKIDEENDELREKVLTIMNEFKQKKPKKISDDVIANVNEE